MAIAALVLGIVTWTVGLSVLTAIPGAIVGLIEMGRIKRGESSRDGKTLATIGFWICTVHIALFFLLICGGVLMALVSN